MGEEEREKYPAEFAGADDIITNLAKEKEPGIEIIERTPCKHKSLIITSLTIIPLARVGYEMIDTRRVGWLQSSHIQHEQGRVE